ncbi:hypothetical protein LSH36_607g01025 [Paralvinella palmiformis]|uniref:Uncharacterized protein n=1 Tax=Paralvinella palmiformis TaxID=53620 RepID=A0AAD9MWJ1_9ANNE|nr:hypothetical protein LSH36_607g01025 [Paralvinella palmiformis]
MCTNVAVKSSIINHHHHHLIVRNRCKLTNNVFVTEPEKRTESSSKSSRRHDKKESLSSTKSTHSSSVETVDRGVGPTPHPQLVSDHRVTPYFGLPPFTDPRNGLFDPTLGKSTGVVFF